MIALSFAAVAVYLLLCCVLTIRKMQLDVVHPVSIYRGPWSLNVAVWWSSFTWGVVVLNRGEWVDVHLGFLLATVNYDRYAAKAQARRKADANAVDSLVGASTYGEDK